MVITTSTSSQSDEVKAIIDQKQNGIQVMLFVKKSDDEGSDFYYMENVLYDSFEDTKMKDKEGNYVPVVNIQFNMDTPVEQKLYNYIAS